MLHFCAKSLFLFLLFISSASNAQVKDKAYSMMLYGLLNHSVPEMSVSEFHAKKDSFQILDSRSREEFETGHIKDAIWVGYDNFQKKKVEQLDPKKPILVYCAVGYRSEKITEKIEGLGFGSIHNLYGGIFEWANNGYPIYKDNGSKTDTIHAYDKVWGVWLNDNYVKRY